MVLAAYYKFYNASVQIRGGEWLLQSVKLTILSALWPPPSFAPVDLFKWLFGDTPAEILFSGVVLGLIGYFAYRWALKPIIDTLTGMANFWKLRSADRAFLEITPPARSEKSALATEHLITILQKFASQRRVLSLEIASSRKEGIRYLICAPRADIPVLKRHFASYLPEVRFRVLDKSYLPEEAVAGQYRRIHEIKQSRHYGYPLYAPEDYSQSDPVAFIAGAMGRRDSNPRMHGPKPCALPLGHAPITD